jgi:hypothetical protein
MAAQPYVAAMPRFLSAAVRSRFAVRVFAVLLALLGLASGISTIASLGTPDPDPPVHNLTMRNVTPHERRVALATISLSFLSLAGVLAHRGWRRTPGPIPRARVKLDR